MKTNKLDKILALLLVASVASAATVTVLFETQPLSAQDRYAVETSLKNAQFTNENYEILFPLASDYFRGRKEGFEAAYNLLHNIDANEARISNNNSGSVVPSPPPPASKTPPPPIPPFRNVRFNP